MNKGILIGYSGHAYVVADAAIRNKFQIIGYADVQKAIKNPFDLKYLGFEKSKDFRGWNKNYGFILGVGDNGLRDKLGKLILERNEELSTVIHSSSAVSDKVYIGKGTFIAAGSKINPIVEISDSVIINTGSIVEHECTIKRSAHIAPGAVLAGNVTVGIRSFIGANSVIKEGVLIGDDVIVGAGTVVLKDVPDNTRIVGNPGRVI